MPRPTVPEVTVELDRTRHLRLDFNALAAFEEATGQNVLRGFTVDMFSVKDIRALLWACLVHEDESLTLTQVGAMLHPSALQEVTAAITGLLDRNMHAREVNGNDPLERETLAATTG